MPAGPNDAGSGADDKTDRQAGWEACRAEITDSTRRREVPMRDGHFFQSTRAALLEPFLDKGPSGVAAAGVPGSSGLL